MAAQHPQNDFTSQFQSDGGTGNAALTLLLNGLGHTYTPQGTDQTISVTEPVVFEMSGSPTFAELNAVIGQHIPCYIHIAGAGVDYLVPYVGQSGSNALYFAIVDAQTETVKYWICNNGGPWTNGSIGLNNVIDSLAKTSLGQVNTLPISQMLSAPFKAGTFLLKADGDGGSAYTFGNVTIPNGQWYRFKVNGETSSFCVIELDATTGNASTDFGTFKILVDSGAPVQVVRVPYERTTGAVGGALSPVYVDEHGEMKECNSLRYDDGSCLPTWETEGLANDPVLHLQVAKNNRNIPLTVTLSPDHPSMCKINIEGPVEDVGAAYHLSFEITIVNNGGDISGGSVATVNVTNNITNDTMNPITAEYAQNGIGGFHNTQLNRIDLPADGQMTKWKVYIDGHAFRVIKLA